MGRERGERNKSKDPILQTAELPLCLQLGGREGAESARRVACFPLSTIMSSASRELHGEALPPHLFILAVKHKQL